MSYSAPNRRLARLSIGTFTPESCVDLQRGSAATTTAWPSDNLAVYQPVRVPDVVTVYKLGLSNGTGISGNIDLGIYNSSWTRLVSTGSTAQSGSYVEQIVDVTDTVLAPGLYYIAVALSTTAGTVYAWSPTAPGATASGVLTEASAFPLPATATPALLQTHAVLPGAFMLLSSTPA